MTTRKAVSVPSKDSKTLQHSDSRYCCLCKAVALRRVGYRGYCKKHYAEAEADRAKFNTLIDQGKMKPRPGFNVAEDTLKHVIKRSCK